MYPIAAMAVVSGTCHVIELADAGHHSAGVLLLQGLAAGGDERLDGPAQQLLPINAGLVDVVLDLRPGPLHELVALCPGDPHVCLAYTRHSVLLDPARIIPARSSTRSAVSVAVARAMASQPPPPIGERAVPGGSSSGLTQTAAAPRATSPGNAGEWTQEPLRPSQDRWKSLVRGYSPSKTTKNKH